MTRLTTILLFFLFTHSLVAQGDREKDKRIEQLKAQKAAFFTEKIGLSSADAQHFWPVYNEFSAQKDSLNHLRWKIRKDLQHNMDELSQSEKTKLMNQQMDIKWKEAELDRHYHQKFIKILSIDQVIKLYEAEHEFKMRIIRQIREIKAEANQKSGPSEEAGLTS